MERHRWCLLIHSLPPKPLYLRAKIRQRLARVGALPLKNSVYVLPYSEGGLEDLQWIAQEAAGGGGDAYVCNAEFFAGVSVDALVDRFNGDRARLYEDLAGEMRGLLRKARGRRTAAGPEGALEAELAHFKKRFEQIRAIDFFKAPAGKEAESLLRTLEGRVRLRVRQRPARATARNKDVVGRTWVTRRGLYIDRLASAWLIRRFVDPKARFRFIDLARDAIVPREIRFDIVGGEFSHEGDRCTFEVLVDRLGIKDAAVAQIAEIVHDVDLKDARYARDDAPGIRQLVNGIVRAHPRDEDRLARGLNLFDELYASFRKA